MRKRILLRIVSDILTMKEENYTEKLQETRMLKLQKIIKNLPSACKDYIRSISTTTSELTRIAYAMDYEIFFDFACKEIPRFSQKKIYEFSDDDIASFTAKEFDIYIDYLKLYYKDDDISKDISKKYKNKESGIMRKLSSLRSLFGYLFRMGRIPGNTAELVPLPKLPSKPILYMEDSEVEAMMDIILNGTGLSDKQKDFNKINSIRDYAIVMLFLGTGMRISELIGINLDDLDLNINAVLITRKGGNSEILYFPDQVAKALSDYIELRSNLDIQDGHENALFLSLQRKRISARAVQNLVKKYATLAAPLKKRLSPHKLRSTYATNLYQNTRDIYLVADALGHSDVNTTRKHYAAMSDEHRRQAAEFINLPKIGTNKSNDTK